MHLKLENAQQFYS